MSIDLSPSTLISNCGRIIFGGEERWGRSQLPVGWGTSGRQEVETVRYRAFRHGARREETAGGS